MTTVDLMPPWLTTIALVLLICVITATATGYVANPPRRKARKDQPCEPSTSWRSSGRSSWPPS